jgi:hypothetical protein
MMWESENSERLNMSFIERLNLTIRQGSAYHCRRRTSYARSRSVWRLTWSCCDAITTSSALTGH